MKRLFTVLAVVLLTVTLWAQNPPQKMSYQAVIRDASNQLVTTQVGMQISIIQSTVEGSVVYSETQTPTPNINGLVTIEIGGGTVVSGDFEAIDWSTGPYFIKTETDPDGETNYTITGTSQLLSVPYALHSKTVASYNETDPIFGVSPSKWITAGNINNWHTAYGWGNHATAGYVPGSRILIINGTSQNLMGTRSWSVGTVTSVGLSLPTVFSVSGSPVTDNGTLSVSLSSQTANTIFASPDGSPGTPAFRALVAADIPGLYDLETKVTEMEDMLIDAGLYTVSDADGNSYNVVKIGNQSWMTENLKTTKYNDGTDIPLVTDNTAWGNLSVAPGYCWYDNDQATYGNTYGALYNWWTVNTGNLCPTGWHVPTDAEWTILTTYLGGLWSAGGKLKETGTTHWSSPNTGATNETGFTALPGGSRGGNGVFGNIGLSGTWWSATEEYIAGTAWYRNMVYNDSDVNMSAIDDRRGFSVRCVKD